MLLDAAGLQVPIQELHRLPSSCCLPCACRRLPWNLAFPQVGNREIVIEQMQPKQVVYIYNCSGSTIQARRGGADPRQGQEPGRLCGGRV